MPSRSLTSFSMSAKALPSAARKQTDPVPVGVKSVAACKVIAADGRAKSASRFGGTGFVLPSSVSRNPTRTYLCLLAELLRDLLEVGQPLLQRRVRREDVRERHLAFGDRQSGREVE